MTDTEIGPDNWGGEPIKLMLHGPGNDEVYACSHILVQSSAGVGPLVVVFRYRRGKWQSGVFAGDPDILYPEYRISLSTLPFTIYRASNSKDLKDFVAQLSRG